MSIVFLHSADWQLGKPFASVSDEAKRERLRQHRIQTVRRLRETAADAGAELLLVAGDLFDSPHVTKATVSDACAAIGSLGIPVLAIPGNHDHGGAGSIWRQEFFQREQEELAPNLRVLLSPEPVVLENAVVFPAPLLRRHEPGDPAAWIRHAARNPDFPAELPRIALVHGSVQGFDARQNDGEDGPAPVNQIQLETLENDAIDYIALGDWHGARQVGPKAWYSGTPEPDRFPRAVDYNPGNVLKVRAARGQAPVVETIPVGAVQWLESAFRFSDDASLELLEASLTALIGPHGAERLLLLTLEGTLGISASARLDRLLETWQARLLRLKLDNRVGLAPTEEEISALTRRAGDPLIAAVAGELVAVCAGDGAEAAVARQALRELHALLP